MKINKSYKTYRSLLDETILTDEMKNYLSLVRSKIAFEDEADQNYDIAITIDIDLKKGNSFDSLGFTTKTVYQEER